MKRVLTFSFLAVLLYPLMLVAVAAFRPYVVPVSIGIVLFASYRLWTDEMWRVK